jgi:hypothetical protein
MNAKHVAIGLLLLTLTGCGPQTAMMLSSFSQGMATYSRPNSYDSVLSPVPNYGSLPTPSLRTTQPSYPRSTTDSCPRVPIVGGGWAACTAR